MIYITNFSKRLGSVEFLFESGVSGPVCRVGENKKGFHFIKCLGVSQLVNNMNEERFEFGKCRWRLLYKMLAKRLFICLKRDFILLCDKSLVFIVKRLSKTVTRFIALLNVLTLVY